MRILSQMLLVAFLFVLLSSGCTRRSDEAKDEQSPLVNTILTSEDENRRWAALEKLTDQKLLERVALAKGRGKPGETPIDDTLLGVAATKKVTDQSILANLVINGSASVATTAAENLTDQDLLKMVIAEVEYKAVARKVVFKLKDPDFLSSLAEEAKHADVRRWAAERRAELSGD